MVFLQLDWKESSINLLCNKQIDHLHVYFKKSRDS